MGVLEGLRRGKTWQEIEADRLAKMSPEEREAEEKERAAYKKQKEDEWRFTTFHVHMQGPLKDAPLEKNHVVEYWTDRHSSFTNKIVTRFPEEKWSYWGNFAGGWEHYGQIIKGMYQSGYLHPRKLIGLDFSHPQTPDCPSSKGMKAHAKAFARGYYKARHEAKKARKASIKQLKRDRWHWHYIGRYQADRRWKRDRLEHQRQEQEWLASMSPEARKEHLDWEAEQRALDMQEERDICELEREHRRYIQEYIESDPQVRNYMRLRQLRKKFRQTPAFKIERR